MGPTLKVSFLLDPSPLGMAGESMNKYDASWLAKLAGGKSVQKLTLFSARPD